MPRPSPLPPHGFACRDLIESRACLVDLVVDFDLPADSVEVADLVRPVRLARNVREEEAVALRGGNANRSTSYLHCPAADGDVSVDGLTVEHDEFVIEQGVEVGAFAGVAEYGASDEALDGRLPVLLEPNDVLNVVRVTFGEAFDARVA